MNKQDAVIVGISESMDFWLSQHPVTMDDILEKASKDAIAAWLDSNTEEMTRLIVEGVIPIDADGLVGAAVAAERERCAKIAEANEVHLCRTNTCDCNLTSRKIRSGK